jgi:parallel beta-helix repeat protein
LPWARTLCYGATTLDLAGHSISGSGTGFGIFAGNGSVTLLNGTVEGFDNGIFSSRVSIRIEGMVAQSNRIGIGIQNGEGTVIRSSATRNRETGIDLSLAAIDVVRSDFSDNGGHGIHLAFATGGTVLERNTVNRNGADGIRADSGALLTKNTADRNAALGINATHPVIDGGKNKARKNGDERQCVGVSC